MFSVAQFLTKEEFSSLNKTKFGPPEVHLFLRVSIHAVLIRFIIEFYYHENWALFFTVYIFNAALFQFLGFAGLAHELYHNKVFVYKKINHFLFYTVCYLLWNNPVFFERSHNYHHRNTFANDDGEAHSLQDFSWYNILFYMSFDILLLLRRILYVVSNSFGLYPAFNPLRFLSIKANDKLVVTHARYILFLQLNLLCILSLFLNPTLGFIIWLTPFSGSLPNRLLAASQHIGLSIYKNEGPLSHSRTLILPKWLSILYAGMNYHCEHHLCPSIPYYNLPALHEILKKKGFLVHSDGLNFFYSKFWVINKNLHLEEL